MLCWKVYVAAKFEERERVRILYRMLQVAGHTITQDWTEETDVSREVAEKDVTGVVECNAFILLPPSDGGRGCWFEFGAAWALDKRIIIVKPRPEPLVPCIFTLLSDVELVDSEEEAVDLLQVDERRAIG